MNSCMFTSVTSCLIGLYLGGGGTTVETLLSYGIRRIPVLSCRWSFGLCRGDKVISYDSGRTEMPILPSNSV
jgi:hypothetical protein